MDVVDDEVGAGVLVSFFRTSVAVANCVATGSDWRIFVGVVDG